MKTTFIVFSLVTLLFFVSCTRTPHSTNVKHSQQLAAESAAALNAIDYAKAQVLAAEATRLNPRFAEAWVGYGMASLRLGQTERARQAYEQALSLHQARHRQNPSDANQVFQQIVLLTLLGQSAEAEALLGYARTNYPNDGEIAKLAQHFSEAKRGWTNWAVGPR